MPKLIDFNEFGQHLYFIFDSDWQQTGWLSCVFSGRAFPHLLSFGHQ
jgi:hypothetical protein